MSGLVAIDWGTTSLRAARLDAGGRVLDEAQADQGITRVAAGGFPAVFRAIADRWPDAPLVLLSGMVGSRQGWREAAYCACPAGFDAVAAQLLWLDAEAGRRAAIVPGLACEHAGVPDVMRGEEVQVFGALDLLGLDDGVVVLPGTHSKWVRVDGRRIVSFATFMTGEVYGLLREQSLLARTMPAAGADGLDEAAFLQGVDHAAAAGSLLRSAFSARTLALFARMDTALLPSYLSGLVIGEELRAQSSAMSSAMPPAAAPVLVGAPALTRRYQLALAHRGVRTQAVGADATWRGLAAIARTLEGAR